MPQIVISSKATQDLQKIREYLQQFNAEAAQKAGREIIRAVTLLQSHPMLGKPLEDIPEYRELIIPFGAGAYIIRYRVDFDLIVIVTIRHSREKASYNL